MLNLAVGSYADVNGKSCIHTHEGMSGHAVYGPYQHLEAGDYVVEFNLEAAEGQSLSGDDVCAVVDVVSNFGRRVFARKELTISQLRTGKLRIPLVFTTDTAGTFEFRVEIRGVVRLIIEDYCRVIGLEDANADYTHLLADTAFPDTSIDPLPAFFLDHLHHLRKLYERGAIVKIVDGNTIVSINGVSFYARQPDDLRFVDEIFFRSTYDFSLGPDCCVIDIGMNIGLVSLTFALKQFVKEVHSFEPFTVTYKRAIANLSLNPEFSHKIHANNFGLADEDAELTVQIYDDSDSGQFSIRGAGQGRPEQIAVKNASTVLRPIIAAARAKGRRVVAKVDCEGSEFPVFQSLQEDGLLCEISAFMVEWHRVFEGKTQRELLAPLIENGFLIFDLTTKTGNGFFYAVRCSSEPDMLDETGEYDRVKKELTSKLDRLGMQIANLSTAQTKELGVIRDLIGAIKFDRNGNIARQISEEIGFKGIQENGLYRAFLGSVEPLSKVPQSLGFTSSLCHQAHFGYDQYRFWVKALKDQPLFYRKQWEFVYIAQVLFERGFLATGKRGIAFGAGHEPLPALFASFGVEILATDQSPEAAVDAGWAKTNQHTSEVSALNQRGICTDQMFRSLVSFLNVDMNSIPDCLEGQFDFCWSACSLEHLGSLQHGLDFIHNAMRVLKPGGLAVHTTEFNISSNEQTYESPYLSIYRRRDIEAFSEVMTERGFIVSPIDWSLGEGFAETVVDLPPYGRGEPHIRLSYANYDVTSLGLILEKPL